MTSIHVDTQPQAANGTTLNQAQSPNKCDEVERVRQRMDGLRKHHNESTDIYNRTQPIINDQIHEETMKYLKSGQVNGTTKTKSQKPRAPKRQRSNPAGNNNNNQNPATLHTNSAVTSTTNGLTPQNQTQQAVPSSQGVVQQGHMQQITLYPPHVQQPPMHLQQQQQQHPHQMQSQQQQHFKYQPTTNIYQPSQPVMQTTQHQYPARSQMFPQQQMQAPSHIHPQHIEQSHFGAQHHGQQSQHFAQHHSQHNGTHQAHHLLHNTQHQGQINLPPLTSLPNDLDLPLQAGLECDVDSLIKHEMSVEGQLDFNHDLLLKLDSHYMPHHHHQWDKT